MYIQVIKTWSENTNNAWGFGGYNCSFTEYDNGVIVREGRNSHRHTGNSSANAILVRVAEDFVIYLRKTVDSYTDITKLSAVDFISVFEYDGHYKAVAKDLDSLTCYGWNYNLIKKIQIPKTT